MQKTSLQSDAIKLIGIKVRTNNQNEADWTKGKIFPCVQQYFNKKLFEKISNRKKPGTTYCAYTEYESDHHGEYTYFIGEEVDVIKNIPEGLDSIFIPAQKYTKFTTKPGAMPTVLSDAWQSIWQMSPTDLGGIRRYNADFEIYDQRATDHNNLVLDIYIGVK